MKKSVYIVLMLLLIGGVFALSTVTNFTSSVLTFNGNSDVATFVKLPGNAYVISSTMTFNGELSDWEVVNLYNASTAPVDADFVSSTRWLVSDLSTGVHLINPTDGTVVDSYNGANTYDAQYIAADKWLFVDFDNDRVVLYNPITDTIIDTFGGLNNPESVDYITDELWLIGDTGNNTVALVNATSDTIIDSLTGLNSVKDVEAVDEEMWMIVDAGTTNTYLYNATSDITVSTYNGLLLPSSVDYVTNELWLVTLNTVNKKVVLLNVTSGTEVASYEDATLSEPRDARYIGENHWLVTDKSGTREVHEMKKYYPTNPSLDIANDSDTEWTYAGEFDTVATVNDADGFTDELNDYLEGLDDDSTVHDVPLLFHSDTSGLINITSVNVLYNQKPNVTVVTANGGEYWAGTERSSWIYYDDDNTDDIIVDVYYWNSSDWVLINAGVNTTTYDWDTTSVEDGDDYSILVHVNDTYNNASDVSDAVFTIDNSFPTADVTMGDTFFRKDGVVITANASDNYEVNRVNATIVCPSNTSSNIVLTNTSANVFTTTWLSDVTTAIGACTVTVDVEDMAGNVNTTTKVITLKLSMDVSFDLSDTNPTKNTDITASGYVYYDNGTVDSRLVNVTFGSNDFNTTSNASGFYTTAVRIPSAGTVWAYVYENGEVFTNSSAVTVKSPSSSGGGGGGGSSASCGDAICQVNRETCTSCPVDCGTCPPIGFVGVTIPESSLDNATITEGDEEPDSESEGDAGIVEQVPSDTGEVFEPEEEIVDNLATGLGFGVFTDFLKKPSTIFLFIVIVMVIAILLLGGWKKKKRAHSLRNSEIKSA